MATKLKIGHKRHSRTPIVTFEMEGLSIKNCQKVNWLKEILNEAYLRHLFLENSPEEFTLLESCGASFEFKKDHLAGCIVTLDTIDYQNFLKETIRTYKKTPYQKEKRPIKTFKEVPEYFIPHLTHTLTCLPHSVLSISDMWLFFRLFLLDTPQRYAIPNIATLEDFKAILFEIETRVPEPWLQGKRYTLKIEDDRLKHIKDCVESGNYASIFNCLSGNCFYYSTRLGLRTQNRFETARLLTQESTARKSLDITVLSEFITVTAYKKENQVYDFPIGQRGLFIVPVTYKKKKRLQIVARPALLFLSVNNSSNLIEKIWLGYDDYEFELEHNLYSLKEYLPSFVPEKTDKNEYTFISQSKNFITLGFKDSQKNKILSAWGVRLNGGIVWHEILKPLEALLEKARLKNIIQSPAEETLFLKRIGFSIAEELNCIYCWCHNESLSNHYQKAEQFIDQTVVSTSLLGRVNIKWPKNLV